MERLEEINRLATRFTGVDLARDGLASAVMKLCYERGVRLCHSVLGRYRKVTLSRF